MDLFDFAIAKIFSLKDSKESGNLARDNGILSALSIRLLLEFEPRRDDARQKESALVAGHMRCCFLIPKHRRYLRSGTPSEPVLAEAAARIMNDTSYGSPVENLKRFLQNGLISKGERGEVVARLLLTLAHDQALPSGLPSASPRYSRPVPVLDFLKNLINLKYWDGVRQSRPANVIGGQTLEEAFKDARLNFTHFVKARDPKIISDEIAWMGLARGMAFVCAYGGEAIDLVIPILLWGEHLNRWVVSAIFFQFKNRASKRRVNIIDAAKLGFFTPPNHMTKPDDDATRYNTRPYITLVMNLGVVQHLGTSKGKERSQGKPGSSSVQTEPGPTRVQPQRRNMKREVQPKKGVRLKKGVHPRYAITITGCSNEVYGVIGSGTEASFAQMLCMYDLLDEHPRRDKKYQDAVLRMKPFWIYDPNSLHWTNHTMEREAPEAELETIHTGQEVEGPESDSDMEVEEG